MWLQDEYIAQTTRESEEFVKGTVMPELKLRPLRQCSSDLWIPSPLQSLT